MLNQKTNKKKFFLMGMGVGIIFIVFLWLTNMVTLKISTDTSVRSNGGHAQNPTPIETEKAPAVENKQSLNLPAENIVDKKMKQKNPPKDVNKEIIYEFPLTEKILLQ